MFGSGCMGKYWQVIIIGIQNTLVYRVNFLCRVLFGFIPLIAILMMWRAVYEGKATALAGYTLGQMISYYLAMSIVDALTAVNEDDWQIAAEIKDGLISQFLLKPIDYLGYRLCLFISGRLVYATVAVLPVSVLIWWYRESFVLPPDGTTLGCFLVSMVLTGLLQFFLSYTMALLAFWVLEVSTFIFILYAFEYLAGGHLFPLDILPPALFKVLQWTPFPYQLFFPVNVYLGRVTGTALVEGLLIQTAWVGLAYLLARWMWYRGVRRYSAVGG
jgi:ABC-2 type transport system permease protein